MECIVYPTRIYFSNTYFSQLRQLKAQLLGYRYLCRDLPLSKRLNELIHGMDNKGKLYNFSNKSEDHKNWGFKLWYKLRKKIHKKKIKIDF